MPFWLFVVSISCSTEVFTCFLKIPSRIFCKTRHCSFECLIWVLLARHRTSTRFNSFSHFLLKISDIVFWVFSVSTCFYAEDFKRFCSFLFFYSGERRQCYFEYLLLVLRVWHTTPPPLSFSFSAFLENPDIVFSSFCIILSLV